MIVFLITIWVLYFFFNRLESEVRNNLWSSICANEQKPFALVFSGLKNQFIQFNEKNLFLSSLVDYRLNLITFRELMIRICLSRVSSVLMLGLVMLIWSAPIVLFIFVAALGILFFFNGKKWGPTLFPMAILGLFYLIAELSVDFIKSALQSAPESPVWFWLADGRVEIVGSLFVLIFSLSLALKRYGFLTLVFFPLFLMGFIPALNLLAVIFAETISSSIGLWLRFKNTFRPIRTILKETLFIKMIVLFILLFFWFLIKGTGLLEIRVMGSLWDKKIIFISIWGLSEIILTSSLMFWGHFRYGSLQPDPSEMINFNFPKIDLKKDSITSRQKFHWLESAKKRTESIKSFKDEVIQSPGVNYPKNLLTLSEKEVESLSSFIELMNSKS